MLGRAGPNWTAQHAARLRIERDHVMANVQVYGAPWCPDCKRAKQFLAEQRVDYGWVDIDKDPSGQDFVRQKNSGRQIIPTIVFGDGSFLAEPSNDELARKLGLTLK